MHGRYYNKYIFEKKEVFNINSYAINDIFDWNDTEIYEFMDYMKKNVRNAISPRPFAVECINMLKYQGNEIYIISSRKERELENPLMETKKWLDKHNIKYDKLFIGDSNKKKICFENNVDIFIDDKIKQCEEVASNGVKTYLFDNLYNKDYHGLERVFDFYELYDKIIAKD